MIHNNHGITIFMPIYNGIEFIEESVSSILNQTYTHWELIIAVNGHKKHSVVYTIAKDVATRSPKIKVVDFYHINGKANALNAMVPLATYDYIALLDVDDIWLPNKLELQVPFLHRYDVVGTQCVYFGESHPIVPQVPLGDISMFDFTVVNPIINSSVIIRKKYCEWNTLSGVEDYYLWLFMRKQNCYFYNVPDVLVKHRIHRASAFNAKGNNRYVQHAISENYP